MRHTKVNEKQSLYGPYSKLTIKDLVTFTNYSTKEKLFLKIFTNFVLIKELQILGSLQSGKNKDMRDFVAWSVFSRMKLRMVRLVFVEFLSHHLVVKKVWLTENVSIVVAKVAQVNWVYWKYSEVYKERFCHLIFWYKLSLIFSFLVFLFV